MWGEEGGEVEDELQAEAWETRWVTRKVIAWIVNAFPRHLLCAWELFDSEKKFSYSISVYLLSTYSCISSRTTVGNAFSVINTYNLLSHSFP